MNIDIDKFLSKSFKSKDSILSMIEKTTNYRVSELNNSSVAIDSIFLYSLISIENFMNMCLKKGETDIFVKKYCDIINGQLENNPLLLYSLPIKDIDINILQKHIPNIKIAKLKCEIYEKKVDNIYTRFSKGESVSSKEISFMIRFLYHSVCYENSTEYIKKYDKLIKMILNHEGELGFNSIGLIYRAFGYNFCRELGLDNVKIIYADIKSEGLTLGQNAKGIVTINKNLYKNLNFTSGSLKDDEIGQYSALIGLKTVFHEIAHSYQDKELDNKKYSNESFYMGAQKIINSNDSNDYRRNYNMQYTENQAQAIGWNKIIEFSNKYYGANNRITEEAKKSNNIYHLKEIFDEKKDSFSRKYYSGDYINMNLDKYFAKNPLKLNSTYSHFLMFYRKDGKPKSLINVLSNSPIRSEYAEFYYSYYLGRIINGETLKSKDLDNLNDANLRMLKNNFIELLRLSYKKLKLFDKNYFSNEVQRRIGRVNFLRNARVIYDVSQRAYKGLAYLNSKYPYLFTGEELNNIEIINQNINQSLTVSLFKTKGYVDEGRSYYGRR